MERQQQGFTLIELIIVIVILGILAAIALPKFVGMQRDARISQLHAMEGSMKAAAALVRGKAEFNGVDLTKTGQTVNVNSDGITTVTADYGYPAAGTTGIQAVVDYAPFDSTTGAGDWTVTTTGTATTFQWKNFSSCNVVYTASTGTNARPTITVTDTGC
jgi:MSHA pilin protein MshA